MMANVYLCYKGGLVHDNTWGRVVQVDATGVTCGLISPATKNCMMSQKTPSGRSASRPALLRPKNRATASVVRSPALFDPNTLFQDETRVRVRVGRKSG